MKTTDICDTDRRQFLHSLSGLAIGSSMLTLLVQEEDQVQQGRRFRDPFEESELQSVRDSVMAQEMALIIDHGYSCAELILRVSLRFLKKPEDCLYAAAAFGGGLGQGDLCGFLTGGMMAIGFAAGMIEPDLSALHALARANGNAYWTWWKEWGSLRCADLRQEYSGREEFLRLGQRAAVKIESLIEPAVTTQTT